MLVVVENTPAVHNMVVCTLCSCYPWPVLGLPPTWYKMPAYRSRAVSEPRAVLREFGVEVPAGREVRVWDSSAEMRYMVLPERPPGTDGLDRGRAGRAHHARRPDRRGRGARHRPVTVRGRARCTSGGATSSSRPDGRRVNVARPRGQLFVCASGCCCGRTEDGFAPVPAETFHAEWERRRLRNVVHLTMGGCLGPCALANVALLLFDGQAQWFHSVNSEARARALYDHVERMLEADRCLPPPADARAVSLHRVGLAAAARRPARGRPSSATPGRRPDGGGPRARRRARVRSSVGRVRQGEALMVDRVVAIMEGAAALPRKNGELVFDEPWHGRVFGMAVALHEQGVYDWEEFRQTLIAPDRRGGARAAAPSSTTRSGSPPSRSSWREGASSRPTSSTRRRTSSSSASATTSSSGPDPPCGKAQRMAEKGAG